MLPLISRAPLIVLAGLLLSLMGIVESAMGRSFSVNYRIDPDPADLLVFDLSILHVRAKVDLKPGQQAGRKFLAYISAVEVNESEPYAAKVKAAGIDLTGSNPAWKTKLADVSNPAWAEFVVGTLAKEAVDKGFNGFFLDTLDSISLLEKEKPAAREKYRSGLISTIKKLREAYPGKEIVVNRGFDLLPELKGSVDGVLIESVFRTFNDKGEYIPVGAADSQALAAKIKDLRSANLPVYVVDYLDRNQMALSDGIVEQIKQTGAEAFLTTKELNGSLTGPIKREARRILVVFGSVLAESEVAEQFASDSFTAERLQMPLEWLGYEVEYLNIGKVSPPPVLDDRFCGIIFDVETQLPYGGEAWYVDWILDHKNRGLKVLFTGQYPFQQDVQRARLGKGLGIEGTYAKVPKPEKVELRKVNKDLMNYEATLTAHPAEIEDSRAPEGSQIDVSVKCLDEAANTLIFDAVYTCDWGGGLMEPYATFQASAEDQASLFDPFKFIQRIFPGGRFPAPDPTTRDGQRIFFSHIDGDGFCGVTSHAGDQICGAIIRDRILKKYPVPITVSLVDASMKGLEIGQNFKDVPMFEEVARSCFALPNVQAASHSFSHPYVWIDNDDEFIPLYESRGLELKPAANYDSEHPVMEKEVRGSIESIQKWCPPGKKVDLMLWSGNCRPSPEALRICRDMGVENMNGGNTVMSKRHPFLSNVSPRVMQWDGELQIHAANQNEFVYTKNWNGPFFGGFAKVIETFDDTEEPRRVKPVNIYYHFYSALTLGSLRALDKVYEWAEARPLHSMTAVDYARLIRDSYETRIYSAGPKTWLLVNQGRQRTFRIEASLGVPDMKACKGVSGFRKVKQWIYVHTDGSPCSTLALAVSPEPRLHLESSQGEISWKELNESKAVFSIIDLHPKHVVVLAGVKPASVWKAVINGADRTLKADSEGRLEIELSGNAEVSVTSGN